MTALIIVITVICSLIFAAACAGCVVLLKRVYATAKTETSDTEDGTEFGDTQEAEEVSATDDEQNLVSVVIGFKVTGKDVGGFTTLYPSEFDEDEIAHLLKVFILNDLESELKDVVISGITLESYRGLPGRDYEVEEARAFCKKYGFVYRKPRAKKSIEE